MIRGIFRGLGGLAFFAATMAFLTAISLLLFGSFLMTWPLLRKSPRDRKIKAATDLAVAGMTAIQAFANRGDITQH